MKRKTIPIDHLDDAQYQELLRLAGDTAALTALAGIAQALEQEHGGNNIETKRRAQRSAMGHRILLEEALGLASLRRRRLAAAALGEPEGHQVENEWALENVLAKGWRNSTPSTRRAESVLRSTLIEDELAALQHGNLRSMVLRDVVQAAGYDWPNVEITDPLAGLVATGEMSWPEIHAIKDRRERRMGVRQSDRDRFIVNLLVMQHVGKRAGELHGVAGNQIPRAFWDDMAKACAPIAQEWGLEPLPPAQIRTLAQRNGSETREVFDRSRNQAAV